MIEWLDEWFRSTFGGGGTAGGYVFQEGMSRVPYIGPYLGAYAAVKDDMTDLRHPYSGYGSDYDYRSSSSSTPRSSYDRAQDPDFLRSWKAELGSSDGSLLKSPDLLASNSEDSMFVPTYELRRGAELGWDNPTPPSPPMTQEPIQEVVIRGTRPDRSGRVGVEPWRGSLTPPHTSMPPTTTPPPASNLGRAPAGHTIDPPPPVSPPDESWLVPESFGWRTYKAGLRDALDPDTPAWARGVLGVLSVLAAPAAAFEELFTRPLLSLPGTIKNLGIGGGEHIGRSLAWWEQGEKAQAADEALQSLIDFVHAFLQLGTSLEGLGGGRPKPSPQPAPKSATRRTIYDVIDETGLNKEQVSLRDFDKAARDAGGEVLPSGYGPKGQHGLDRVFYFRRNNRFATGEAKVKSGYQLGDLRAALDLLDRASGKIKGKQGSAAYTLRQAIEMITGKSTAKSPISAQVRETGRKLLENFPGHRRLLLVMNEFGEFEIWDLDFWEMYDWADR